MPFQNSKSLVAAPRSYVFAVCGDAVHVNSLNLSLTYLRKFSRQQILVVTDLARTAEKIQHDCIIDVRTPNHLDDHQASIFLKTTLHRTLPGRGTLHCYLDSDVIAVRSDVDEIFDQMQAPIMFAPDNISLSQFSPWAMQCECSLEPERRDRLKALEKRFSPPVTSECRIKLTEVEAVRRLRVLRRLRLQEMRNSIRRWYRKGLSVGWQPRRWRGMAENLSDFVKSRYGCVLDASTEQRLGPKATPTHREVACNHLQQAIANKFGVRISNSDWQHWNGGVFLFDERSHDFMDTWHAWSLQILDDPKWKTRDQGTLAATAWHHGLQNQPVLPHRFNLIADYHNPSVQFLEGTGFRLDRFQDVIDPSFVHVIHHWGDEYWPVWSWIQGLLDEPDVRPAENSSP